MKRAPALMDWNENFNQREISTVRRPTQAEQVLSSNAPRPLVNPFDEVAGDTRVVQHMGPQTVQNDGNAIYRTGKNIPSLEITEEVFLRENFDMRDDFDSALAVENEVQTEMAMPVVESVITNTEIPPEDLPEGRAEKAMGPKITKEKILKYAPIAAIAYLLLFRK